MSKYAVIKLNNVQYKVNEGDELLVDKITDKKALAEVLLVVDGENVKVGDPVVKGAKVDFKILEEVEKGDKVTVVKYRSKSRYRKTMGFRPVHTRIKVTKIS